MRTFYLAAVDWNLVKEADDLRVESRPYQGSDLDEVRGVAVVEASLSALMALLRDAAYNKQWVHRSGGATILLEEGYERVYVYGIVEAPLPMRNRDTVVRFDFQQHPETKIILITITNFPAFIPEKEAYVRVPDFGGFWQLRPLWEGRVEVTYQVYGAPGGWVPLWLANYSAKVSVTRTLQNLVKAVNRYEGARSPRVLEWPGK